MFADNVAKLRQLLENTRNAEKPLVFTVPGSGLSALSAVKGGVPFLVVLNSGFYRMAGVTSHASFLPFGNANEQTETLIRTQILPRCPHTPLVAGLLVNDPGLDLAGRFQRLRHLGVAGIINWPPVSMNTGSFLDALRKRGFSEEEEADMLAKARKAGFVTFGFSATPQSALLFVSKAAVDVLIINVGWTLCDSEPLEKQDRVQYAIRHTNQILETIRERCPGEPPVCLFYGGGISTAQDTLQLYQQTRVDGLGVGSALEYFPVKDLMQGLSHEFVNISKKKTLIQEIRDSPSDFIGTSPAVIDLYHTVRRVAAYDVSVCIEGESGSGKDVIANSLHELSSRSMRPFITVNCGAIPETLIESEFFGHERGAFTGALERRLGKFELANHGTLFLDEVAELSPKAQVCLLRAIQQKEIVRVGGRKNIPVDIRLITATNRRLKDLVRKGEFRADLFYRLNTISLYIPPLRERVSDIEALARHFLKDCQKHFGCAAQSISKDFLRRLARHSWPGNVRELQHVLVEAAIMEDGEVLMGYNFVPEPPGTPEGADAPDAGGAPDATDAGGGLEASAPSRVRNISDFRGGAASSPDMETRLKEALTRSGGNKARAAQFLGISRKTLYVWLNRLSTPQS